MPWLMADTVSKGQLVGQVTKVYIPAPAGTPGSPGVLLTFSSSLDLLLPEYHQHEDIKMFRIPGD